MNQDSNQIHKSGNRNMLVWIWCLSLFEWASLQTRWLEEKLLLTADNQIKTRRLGFAGYPSSSATLLERPTSLDSGRAFMREGLAAPASFDRSRVVCLCVWCNVCLCVYKCVGASGALEQSVLDGCALFPRPPQLEQSSQHLPLKGIHYVDHLQAAGDFFQDAVLLPQLVQLPVALGAEVQWIAPSGKENTQSTQWIKVSEKRTLNTFDRTKWWSTIRR